MLDSHSFSVECNFQTPVELFFFWRGGVGNGKKWEVMGRSEKEWEISRKSGKE